jgi:hypothetical protein
MEYFRQSSSWRIGVVIFIKFSIWGCVLLRSQWRVQSTFYSLHKTLAAGVLVPSRPIISPQDHINIVRPSYSHSGGSVVLWSTTPVAPYSPVPPRSPLGKPPCPTNGPLAPIEFKKKKKKPFYHQRAIWLWRRPLLLATTTRPCRSALLGRVWGPIKGGTVKVSDGFSKECDVPLCGYCMDMVLELTCSGPFIIVRRRRRSCNPLQFLQTSFPIKKSNTWTITIIYYDL